MRPKFRRHIRRTKTDRSELAERRQTARKERGAGEREEVEAISAELKFPIPQGHFDSNTARALAVLCTAAYHTDPEQDAWLETLCHKVVPGDIQIEVFSENDRDTEGFAIISSEALILVFCGTNSLRDWQTNLTLTLEEHLGAYVHSGFWQGLDIVWEDIDKLIAAHPDLPIHVTGHSLGGALALTAAHRLLAKGRKIQTIHTYGQPLVGAGDLRATLSDLEPSIFRIVNEGDPVPLLPGLVTRKLLPRSEWKRKRKPGTKNGFVTDKYEAVHFEEIGNYLFLSDSGELQEGKEHQTISPEDAANLFDVVTGAARKILSVNAHDIVNYAKRL